jgi:hypothetical protein
MADQPRRFGAIDAVVLLSFLVASTLAMSWEDRRFGRDIAGDRLAGLGPEVVARRPGWVWSLEKPSRRLRGDLKVFLLISVVGVGTAPLRRPGLLRAGRRAGPGIVAGLVGSLSLAYAAVLVIAWLYAGTQGYHTVGERFFTTFFQVGGEAARSAILGSWVYLALSRGWHPRRRDWDDRVGCILGWGWISIYLYDVFYPAIWL